MSQTKAHPETTLQLSTNEAPISEATAFQVARRLQLTEQEGQIILGLPEVSEDEVHEALKVNLHGIAAAYPSAVTRAIEEDGKIELPQQVTASQVARQAATVRLTSSIVDKLELLHGYVAAAAIKDASVLQKLTYDIVPQVVARSRVNTKLNEIFSALLAYHHARHPGRRGHASPPPASPPAQTPAGK